jgi:hypothetical protein
MNTLTEIIELRSSCQMVWNNLNEITDPLDFSKLENAVYFMSKVISLVSILSEGSNLKPKDHEIFKKIQHRMCE